MSDPAHPNVPFLVMRSTGDLPVEPTLLKTDPPRDDDWDESGLGWRGFPRSDQPPIRLWGWWGLFGICAVAVVAMRSRTATDGGHAEDSRSLLWPCCSASVPNLGSMRLTSAAVSLVSEPS